MALPPRLEPCAPESLRRVRGGRGAHRVAIPAPMVHPQANTESRPAVRAGKEGEVEPPAAKRPYAASFSPRHSASSGCQFFSTSPIFDLRSKNSDRQV